MLAEASEGFSGAEIEQAVVAALYTAHAQRTQPSVQSILAEIQATRPLSILMAEKVSAISEDGVPGYVVATSTPASRAPRVIASFPSSRICLPGLSCVSSDIINT